MLGSQQLLTDSKQLYHLTLRGGRCELAVPKAELAPFIDYYWLLTIDQPRLVLQVIPDTAIDLVLSPGLADFAALYLPVSKPFAIELEGPIQYAGVCFRSATVAQLPGLEFNALRQLKVGMDTIESLNIRSLVADIQCVESIGSIAKKFNNYWLERLHGQGRSTDKQTRVSHAAMLAMLEEATGSGSIAAICETLGVSERQFRRLSIDLFGLSPKKLQNVLRLQTALDELFRCEPRQLQDLYYDDSHRIRELKRLTGCTPRKIRRMAEKYNKR